MNNFNEEQAVISSVEFLKRMANDEAVMAAQTFEEKYKAFRKYVHITKEKFRELLDQMEPVISEDDNELSEYELDMVVGGSLWSSIKKAVSKVASAVSSAATTVWNATPNWVKGAVVGAVAVAAVAAVFCTGGAAIVAFAAEAGTAMAEFTAAFSAASSGIAIGAAGGAAMGAFFGSAM